MTRIVPIVFGAVLAGCYSFGKTADSLGGVGATVTLDQHGNAIGAAAHGVGGVAGWHADLELVGERVHKAGDPRTFQAVGLGLALRVSPLGLLANEHRLERFFDFGVETGFVGSVVVSPEWTTRAAVSGGVWVELGLMAAAGGYMAVTGNVRTVNADDPWTDQEAVFLVGLAWRHREPTKPNHFTIAH
jgi:hypothetical protein